MSGGTLQSSEPQPPPSVRIKLLWLDISGSGTLGIGGLILLVIILLLAAYLMRSDLSALFQVAGALLSRFRQPDWT